LAACSNPVETRVAQKCEQAFVDPPGERTTYDSIQTICKCFSKGTAPMAEGNYLARVEAAMSVISDRRTKDDTSWIDAYVALERDYTAASDEAGLRALKDALDRISAAQEDVKDGKCEGLF